MNGETDHGRSDAVDHVDDGARIGIEQCAVVGRNLRRVAGRCFGSEDAIQHEGIRFAAAAAVPLLLLTIGGGRRIAFHCRI